MKHVYHHHAMWFSNGGGIAHSDGISTLEGKIITYNDYLALKEMIAKESGVAQPPTIIICSLTLIHTEP